MEVGHIDFRRRALCAFCSLYNVCPELRGEAVEERDLYLRPNNGVEVPVDESDINLRPEDAGVQEVNAREAIITCLRGKRDGQCTIKGIKVEEVN